jgi:hypothetical protein
VEERVVKGGKESDGRKEMGKKLERGGEGISVSTGGSSGAVGPHTRENSYVSKASFIADIYSQACPRPRGESPTNGTSAVLMEPL